MPQRMAAMTHSKLPIRPARSHHRPWPDLFFRPDDGIQFSAADLVARQPPARVHARFQPSFAATWPLSSPAGCLCMYIVRRRRPALTMTRPPDPLVHPTIVATRARPQECGLRSLRHASTAGAAVHHLRFAERAKYAWTYSAGLAVEPPARPPAWCRLWPRAECWWGGPWWHGAA